MVVLQLLERWDGVVVNAKGLSAHDSTQLTVFGYEALELLHSLLLVLLHHLQTRAAVLLHLQHGATFLLLHTTKHVSNKTGARKHKYR